MKKQTIKQVLLTATGIALTGLSAKTRAAINVDGSLDAAYGAPLSTQTVNSGFGDSTSGNGTSSSGSELDAAYANVSNGNLYLFFSGNFENNGNHVNIFIADNRSGGQNVLTGLSNPLGGANGLTLPTGFNATYILDGNDYNNTFYFDQYDLTHNTTGNYLGAVNLNNGIGNVQNLTGIAVGVNNTNAAGVDGTGGTAANASSANAVTTGLEFAIPLSALGSPTGSIQVLAAINSNGDNFLSNQFLPGLPLSYGNLGSPASVDLSNNGVGLIPISVVIPTSPNGIWLPTAGGNWNASANWSNGIIPNAAGVATTFASATATSTVLLNGHYTVGSVTFNSAFSYEIAAGTGGVLTLDNGSANAAIVSYTGTQLISAPIVLNSTTTVTAASHGNVIVLSGNISGGGGLAAFDLGGGSQTGGSNIIVSGSNSYTGGTNVSGGNLTLGSATALPANSALTLSALDLPSGVLDLNSYSASVSSLTVLSGPQTAPTGSVAQIINTNASAGTAVLTYTGTLANPSNFSGIITDNAGSGGATTALLVTSGSLTLSHANYYAGSTNVSGGTLTLGAAGALPSGTNLTVGTNASVIVSNLGAEAAVTVGSLSVTGKLDLNNNGLAVHNSSVGAVTTLLSNGYNKGKWNGSTGIVSTTAASDTTHLTTLGVILNNVDGSTPLFGTGAALGQFNGTSPLATDVLVKYTYYGDTNLDGIVDGTDYSRIDNGFANHLAGWANGDLNYDNVINGSDYTLIDNAFNQQGASLATAVAASQVATAAVPEPTSLGLLGLGAAGLLGRRRFR